MKHCFLAGLLAFTVIGTLRAQPTITRSWLGQPGDIVASRDAAAIPDISPIGQDVTWDFSGIQPADTLIYGSMYVEADTTAFFAQYPTANICLFAIEEDPEFGTAIAYQYAVASDERWEELGLAASAPFVGTVILEYSNPRLNIPFPMTYQTQSTDDYSGTLDIIFGTSYISGSGSIVGDAWGTVILPNGVFSGCLRVKYESMESDSSAIFDITKTVANTVQYLWIHPSHPAPLASYSETESYTITFLNGVPVDTTETEIEDSFSWDPTAISSSVKYFRPDAYALQMNPNPFGSTLNLNFTLEQPEELRFEIQTVSGQTVYHTRISGSTGQNVETLEPPDIPAGTYIAILYGEKHASAVKLVKAE